jgi:pimeloyl-ACP methyl ester carboxylesterase
MSASESASAGSLTAKAKSRRVLTTRVLLGLLFLILVLGVRFVLHLVLPRTYDARGEVLEIELPPKQPEFEGLFYCLREQPLGIVVLGTGNGGWSYWEEKTATHLSEAGFAVIGWDYRKYVTTREFTHDDLIDGFVAAVEAVYERTGCDQDIPIWYGGWSTGAEQSVAAASSPRRPENLIGLLLAAPASRGRFGLETSDLLGVLPTGPDSFAMTDMAPGLDGLHVAQFVAGLDPMGDVAWLEALKTPYRRFELPTALHDMGGAGPAFQGLVDEAIRWSLEGTRFEGRVDF